MLRDGVHGLLVRDDDDEAVASQVIRLLEEPAYARALAAAARKTCVAYQWPLVRGGWLAVYQSVTPALETRHTMTSPADSRRSGPIATSRRGAASS
jgi:hypothetical protein